MAITFEILARSACTGARLGRVHTPHGSFDTPAFMPVGTRATVRGLLPGMVARTGAQIILGNTYHLMLRPGDELIARLGGLHGFTNWHGPILTDSGGYQAYSMADLNTVTDDGVTFKSIVDGGMVTLTPERAVHIQNNLGADIIMAFDDCPPSVDPAAAPTNQTRLRLAASRDAASPDGAGRDAPDAAAAPRRSLKASRAYDHPARLKQANERTVRWLERCKAAHRRDHDQALFGIVQGGTDLDARAWSAQQVCGIDLPGYAIGGVAVGEMSGDIARVVRHVAPLLPEAKPRYLMGVGYERDILCAVLAGVDMFDCVLPTRNGRNAGAFTRAGQIRLRNAQYAEDPGPIEAGCDCPACSPALHGAAFRGPGGDSPFSRAYIRHLFMAKEMLGPILVSLHNLRYVQRLIVDIRATIRDDDWLGFVGRWPSAAAGLPALPARA